MMSKAGFLLRTFLPASRAAGNPAKPHSPSHIGRTTREERETSSTAHCPEATGASPRKPAHKGSHGRSP